MLNFLQNEIWHLSLLYPILSIFVFFVTTIFTTRHDTVIKLEKRQRYTCNELVSKLTGRKGIMDIVDMYHFYMT